MSYISSDMQLSAERFTTCYHLEHDHKSEDSHIHWESSSGDIECLPHISSQCTYIRRHNILIEKKGDRRDNLIFISLIFNYLILFSIFQTVVFE